MDDSKKVLTYPRLSLFLSEIRKIFANKTHTHNKSEIGLGNVDNTADSVKSVKYATSAGSASNSTTATKLGTITKGSATQPIYLNDGTPTPCTYSLGKSVPSNAVFTDTKYTHPSYAAKTSGLYKLSVDSTGHVNGATPVTKADITALGIPAQDTNTTYSVATRSANGLLSSTDKTKLDGIASGANKYVHPTTSGNKHIPTGGKTGQVLKWSADGTAVWGTDKNTTYANMTGATSAANGKSGLVPAPAKGEQGKFLMGDGTWGTPSGGTLSSLGITATADELNYAEGVTSSIQDQLDAKAKKVHNHALISKTEPTTQNTGDFWLIEG